MAPAVLDEVLERTPPQTEAVDTGRQECVGGPAPVPPLPSDADVAGEAGKRASDILGLTAPTPKLDPGPITLVNFATILTTGENETVRTRDTTLLGIPVTFTAIPHFRWTLQDLPDIVTDDPGTAYDGTDPAKSPNLYVTATWTTTGSKAVAVEAAWDVSVVRKDNGTALTIPPIDRIGTTQVLVKQSHAILTGNS